LITPPKSAKKARDALADARKLQRIEGTKQAVVNRLYCACFHAAQSVLYSKGFEPSTHRGVVSLFGEEVVLAGEATKAHGRFLSDMRDRRQQADYGYEPITADLEALTHKAGQFVNEMEKLP
jgi:uncharacterized protein (UPF0332 family)